MRKQLMFMLLAFTAAAYALPSPAQSAEEIRSFHSDVVVRPDASLQVTETIRVYAEGVRIKRGIYRDFPTRYKDHSGRDYRVGFQLLSVKRDGRPEAHHTKNLSNGIRIYAGKRDVFLSPGEYTYTFTYSTTGQLGFYDEHDELYWNVTGNGWDFPVLAATATVHLPEGASYDIDTTGYTGVQGSRERAVSVDQKASGEIDFYATRPLAPKEGLTVVVAFPKGFVTEPARPAGNALAIVPGPQKKHDFILVILFIILLYYYGFAWVRVGADPDKGTIIPLYHPPKKLEPDAARYLMKMGFDKKILTVAIIQLAVKKVIRIEERKKTLGPIALGGEYILHRENYPKKPLTPHEKRLDRKLFSGSATLELKNKNHDRIGEAIEELKKGLKVRVGSAYLRLNFDYFCGGMIMSILFFLVNICSVAFLDHAYSDSYLMLFWISVALMNWIFYHLIKAPTLQGRKLMDRVEGFRMFLCATEKERLKWLNTPEKTPELYEAYLPYAIALDVEDKWSRQFTDILARAAEEGYSPSWYVGYGGFRADQFTHDLGHSFSNAISAASHPPGSSSGMGGGGFSGGGGGGGGGGGW